MASIAPQTALHPAVEQIQSAYARLSNPSSCPLSRSKAFEQLGVHPNDRAAQSQLLEVIRRIAREELVAVYSPEEKIVRFCDHEKNPQAVFKPGLTRALDESYFRRMAYLMGTPDSAIPAMIATFDFSRLPPVRASELNPDSDVFDDDSSTLSDGIDSGGEEENGEDSVSNIDPMIEFPFAQDATRSRRRICFLPEVASESGTIFTKDTLLQPRGTLPGVLEPWISSQQDSTVDRFARTVLFAAALGMRDFKLDAMVGNTIIDAEEIMAAAVSNSKSLQPSVHLPVLNDSRAIQHLTPEQRQEISTVFCSLDIPQLVKYACSQKILYRMVSLEVSNPDSSEIETAYDLIFISEREKGREKQYFPHISVSHSTLYTKSQIRAFAARLTNLQKAASYLIKDQNLRTVGELVCRIDSAYGRYIEAACLARDQEMTQPASSGLSSMDSRMLLVLSPPNLFLDALTQQAGRHPLAINKKVVKVEVSKDKSQSDTSLRTRMRDRTSSMPEMMLYQSKKKAEEVLKTTEINSQESPKPLVRANSASSELSTYFSRFLDNLS